MIEQLESTIKETEKSILKFHKELNKYQNDISEYSESCQCNKCIAQWRLNMFNYCVLNFEMCCKEYYRAVNGFNKAVRERQLLSLRICCSDDKMTDAEMEKLVEDPEAAQRFIQKNLI